MGEGDHLNPSRSARRTWLSRLAHSFREELSRDASIEMSSKAPVLSGEASIVTLRFSHGPSESAHIWDFWETGSEVRANLSLHSDANELRLRFNFVENQGIRITHADSSEQGAWPDGTIETESPEEAVQVVCNHLREDLVCAELERAVRWLYEYRERVIARRPNLPDFAADVKNPGKLLRALKDIVGRASVIERWRWLLQKEDLPEEGSLDLILCSSRRLLNGMVEIREMSREDRDWREGLPALDGALDDLAAHVTELLIDLGAALQARCGSPSQ